MIKRFFLLLAILFFVPLTTHATGISVRPQKLEIESSFGREVIGEILIDNISDEPAIYNVYPDDYIDNVQVSPNEFQLQPSESRIIELKTKMWLNGKYCFDLSIVSRSLNSTSMSVVAGVKLPVLINITGWTFWLVIFFVVLIIIWVIWLAITRRK